MLGKFWVATKLWGKIDYSFVVVQRSEWLELQTPLIYSRPHRLFCIFVRNSILMTAIDRKNKIQKSHTRPTGYLFVYRPEP